MRLMLGSSTTNSIRPIFRIPCFLCLRLSVGEWKDQRETNSTGPVGRKHEIAPLGSRDVSGKRQAETRPPRLGGGKRFKNAVECRLRNRFARVFHVNADSLISIVAAQFDRPA